MSEKNYNNQKNQEDEKTPPKNDDDSPKIEKVEIPKNFDVKMFKIDWKQYKVDLEEAERLEIQDSSEKEPFKFKYKAREIYNKYIPQIELQLLEENKKKLEESVVQKLYIEYGILSFLAGKNYYDTEEVQSGQIGFDKAISTLRPYAASDIPKSVKQLLVPPLLESYNLLGAIWFQRKQFNMAQKNLSSGEYIFNKMKLEMKKDKKFIVKLDKLFILTCFFFAQTYQQMENQQSAVFYSFKTLKLQFQYRHDVDMEFKHANWALNTAQLSTHFVSTKNFSMAEHCLLAARNVIKMGEKEKVKIDPEIDANLFLLFGTFYSALLIESKFYITNFREELIKRLNNEREKQYKKRKELNINESDEDEAKRIHNEYMEENGLRHSYPVEKKNKRTYIDLPNKHETFMDMGIENLKGTKRKYLMITMNEAKVKFKLALKCFEQAKKYYVLDGYVSVHIEISQKITKLYKLLSFFETSLTRRILMYQRRINIINPLVKALNKNVYLAVMKQLVYEISECHVDMVSEYYSIIENGSKKNEDFLKLNETCLNAIEAIRKFQNLFMEKKLKDFSQEKNQENLEEKLHLVVEKENRPAYVTSIMNMASVYYKIQMNEFDMQKKFLLLSRREFQKILDFVESEKFDDKEKERMKSEINLSREMIGLIPLKIRKLQMNQSKKVVDEALSYPIEMGKK